MLRHARLPQRARWAKQRDSCSRGSTGLLCHRRPPSPSPPAIPASVPRLGVDALRRALYIHANVRGCLLTGAKLSCYA
jgi:hypothetical protein